MAIPQSTSTASTQSHLTVEQLLRNYAENDPHRFDIFFRRMRGTYPQDCIQGCVRHLGHNPASGAPSRQMLLWLTSAADYMSVLLDPQLMSPDATRRAALAIRDGDAQFFTKLARFLQDPKTVKPTNLLMRVLDLVPAFGECGILIPWLRALGEHSDEQVRLQSAKTLCELRPTRVMVERQLQSSEPQTRADALEALWRVPGSEAKTIFRFALTDTDHRVVAKALVGLHLNNDSTAIERMIEMAGHRSAIARLAAIAAMMKAADSRCAPALERLCGDSSAAVREAAKVAFTCLPAPAITPSELPVLVENDKTHPPKADEKKIVTFETPAFRLL